MSGVGSPWADCVTSIDGSRRRSDGNVPDAQRQTEMVEVILRPLLLILAVLALILLNALWVAAGAVNLFIRLLARAREVGGCFPHVPYAASAGPPSPAKCEIFESWLGGIAAGGGGGADGVRAMGP